MDATYMALRITHALFDFDGTISLIREGWQPIMTEMAVEMLMRTPQHESREDLSRISREFIDELTGRQTIYQMIRLAEEVEKRGGAAEDPMVYKTRYVALIEAHIKERIWALESGADRTPFFLRGAKEFLELLYETGISLSLASGTDEEFVRREARLLGVEHLFDQIGGARANYKEFSKRIAIENIIKEGNIDARNLAVFGDGFVEIEEAKKVGAYAVGVASDESGSGKVDVWKKERLTRAGADTIVADFSDTRPIIATLSA